MEKVLGAIKKRIPDSLFRSCQPAYHFLFAFTAALRYGFPSRRLIVIGVTGTKGKTTVVHLIHEILASSLPAQAGGANVASLSSVRFKIGANEEQNDLKMTMPGRLFVQKFLRRAVRAHCKYVVIEVTSQGIAQSRHRFIRFHTAVMTNIAPEHIESHGNFERYLRAKLDLFWRLQPGAIAIINRDDPAAGRFAAATSAYRAWYSAMEIVVQNKVWHVAHREFGRDGIRFEINSVAFPASLRGEFNFYNILAALAVGLSQRISLERMAAVVTAFSGVPGRMESIQQVPFVVMVDYAHTPDSLRSVYTTLRGERVKTKTRKPRLICVLGSTGGGRDRWKRPELGRIAAEYCSETIVTNEDPYDEEPMAIVEEIAAGYATARPRKTKIDRCQKILDRREAIATALRMALRGDIVVITGKGAEPWLMVASGGKIPWDDRAVAREELQKLHAINKRDSKTGI